MKDKKTWQILESEEIFKTPFTRLRRDRCQLPSGKVMPGYYVMEFSDWVNVVPVLPDGRIVLIEQYRHAIGANTLEIPGGGTEKSDPSLQHAAERELAEETGYVPESWVNLGFVTPNPALLNNRMHVFVALNCRLREQGTEWDEFEDIAVHLVTQERAYELLSGGEIHHAIVAASLWKALHWLKSGNF